MHFDEGWPFLMCLHLISFPFLSFFCIQAFPALYDKHPKLIKRSLLRHSSASHRTFEIFHLTPGIHHEINSCSVKSQVKISSALLLSWWIAVLAASTGFSGENLSLMISSVYDLLTHIVLVLVQEPSFQSTTGLPQKIFRYFWQHPSSLAKSDFWLSVLELYQQVKTNHCCICCFFHDISEHLHAEHKQPNRNKHHCIKSNL